MPVSSANGSPTLVASAALLAISLASSCLASGTSILVGALQDCPLLLKQCFAPPVIADSKSASSNIIFADLPPSSCATLFTVSAAPFATAIPALVEPVKDIISMRG